MIRDLTVIPTLLAKPHTVLGRVELPDYLYFLGSRFRIAGSRLKFQQPVLSTHISPHRLISFTNISHYIMYE